jgi:hypothetical protein
MATVACPLSTWTLRDPESDETYTFATSSRGGLDAIGELCKAYGKAIRQKPNQYPLIELDGNSYMHRDCSVGRVKFPILKVVGWINKSDPQDAPGAGRTRAAAAEAESRRGANAILKEATTMIDSLESLNAELDECPALLRPYYVGENDKQLRDRAMCWHRQRCKDGRWLSSKEIEDYKAEKAAEKAAKYKSMF